MPHLQRTNGNLSHFLVIAVMVNKDTLLLDSDVDEMNEILFRH
jgi:hypothetical protein